MPTHATVAAPQPTPPDPPSQTAECQGSPPAYLLPGGYWTCGHDNGYSHGGNEYNNEGSGSREYPMASSANYGSGNDGYCGGVCDTAVGYRGERGVRGWPVGGVRLAQGW
jgi:hypothetical protein